MKFVRRWLGCAALLIAVALLPLAGCGKKESGQKAVVKPGAGGDEKGGKEEEHATKGPHGGALAELGDKEEYHAELTTDKAKKQATVYILDGKAAKTVAIKAKDITLTLKDAKPPVQVKLSADAQKDDKGGSSRFVGTHPKFAEEIDPDEVEVSVVVAEGKPPIEGTFKPEKGHDHKKDKK